jgi:3-dehydroquinate synthase
MKKITIKTNATYDVIIGKELLENVGKHLQEALQCDKLCIVSDEIVYGLYGKKLFAALENAGYEVCTFTFPAGEDSKNMDTVSALLEFMANEQLTRADAIVAFGGGVTGDLAGFAASCYLRGISFVQIPTTLLAAVDSSVGGKTGVNLSHGKNLAGAFWQPALVLCDCSLFKSLPHAILLDGIAEIIKYGVIADEELFELLASQNMLSLIESNSHKDIEKIENIIERCVKIKADIVSQDERDTGIRMLLNFGHTLGHAIEKCSNYEISHGHAVAIGMLYISRFAKVAKLSPAYCASRIEEILIKYGFKDSCEYSSDELCDAVFFDKKRVGDSITLILPDKIGSCRLEKVNINTFREILGQIVGVS